MKTSLPGPKTRIIAWILLIPVLGIVLTWSLRTADMYQFLALRNLGDERLGGMTLQRAGELQYYYLRNEILRDISQAIEGTNDDLPRVHLFIRDDYLERLDSALPRSGFDYVEGYLLNEGDFDKVKLRYRGDFATHWGLFKKSFRIKTNRNRLFHGVRKFNLVAPKSAFLNGNHFGYVMARELGLLTPASALVKVSVNGVDKGVHLFVEQIGETFLRNVGRLPGDIYKGDQNYGEEVWYGLDVSLFDESGLWEKMSYNNHYPEHHDEPLRVLLEALATNDQETISQLLDLEAFARFNLWEQLANSRHNDNNHNWRLYYDPGLGRFEPILWDGMPWSEYWLSSSNIKDWTPPESLIASHLMEVLHRHGEFMRVKHRVFHEFVTGNVPERLLGQLRELNVQTRAVARDELVILDEFNRRVSPEESIARMDANVPLLEEIIDGIRDQYGSPLPEAAEESDVVNWSGLVEISEDTVITSKVSIAPGTRIRIDAGKSLFFRNTLTVNGTREAPVTVRPAGAGYFGALVLEGEAANGSRLSWLDVSGGSGYRDELREYSGMVSIHDVKNVQMNDCRLSGNQAYDDQLHLVYSSASISGCVFEDAPFDAIDIDMSELTIERSSILNNGNDGIDLMGSRMDASELVVRGNGDKGFSVGERSILVVRDSEIRDNAIGVQVKDDSLASVNGAGFRDNGIAIDAYRKNWRYGTGGYGMACESEFLGNSQDFQQDAKSSVTASIEACPQGAGLEGERIERLKQELKEAQSEHN